MKFQIRRAEKKQAKIKLALQGPSGSGKTYGALLMAYGLIKDWSKIVVVDTENRSSDLYADFGEYSVLPLDEPFTPERYIDAIHECEKEGFEVIIIDSISHCWRNLTTYHSTLQGNSYTNWNKVTPRQDAFVQKILQSQSHIIATIRSKQDYVLNEKNGKMVPEKVGLKGIQREDVDYEFTIVFDLDLNHNAKATKDRTSVFMNKPEFIITAQTGEEILQWCSKGTDINEIKNLIGKAKTNDELLELFNRYKEFSEELKPVFTLRKKAINETKAEAA